MRVRMAGLLVIPLMLAAWATPASAQIFYPPRYPYPYPYGYPYRYAGPSSDIRIEVKPKNAMVYVDGYYAGQVDDFDGVFQRLHVAPGTHDIVIYLQGYHSLHQPLYVGPNTTRSITARLEPLAPGEPNEPPPVPAAVPAEGEPGNMPQPMPPPPGRYPPPRRGRGAPPPQPPEAQRSSTVGSVVIRVQPAGSAILIDGERWDAPAQPDERLVVQLSAGHHIVDVSKSGYRTMSTGIDVRAGESTPVNVSLTPE